MKEDKQDQVINLLAENEKKIGELYSMYAEKFPDYHNLFVLLAGEEEAHSQWIKGLYNDVLSGDLFVDQERFNINALKLFADYIKKKIADIQDLGLTLKKALGIGLDIENTLIESKWFEVYSTDKVKMRIALKRIQEANYIHKKKFTEALSTIKDT